MNLFDTYISEEAKKLVSECISSNRISAGKMADKFETELESQLGIKNVFTVNSGTTALHLSVILAGVKEGDEVILPAQTFIATGLAVLYEKAIPVFCDVDVDTGNVSVESIKNKITSKTKAVIVVHWAGYPCNMDEIIELCEPLGIKVIEDAAHAVASTYKNRPIGSISDFTCFSFQAIKHLTTGDGGAVACKSKEDCIKGKRLRWFDIDRELAKPDIMGERVYDAVNVGYKYHLNDIASAMGVGNLTILKDNIKKVRNIGFEYFEKLQNVSGLSLMKYENDRQSSFWLFPILVSKRENFITALKEVGVPTSVVHVGIDKNSIFGGKDYSLKNQRIWDDHQIHIPINPNMDRLDVEHVINTIKKGW